MKGQQRGEDEGGRDKGGMDEGRQEREECNGGEAKK
jgi:hypothetical protein